MDIYKQYEKYKKYLRSLNLNHQEYYKRLKEWCDKNNF